MTNIEIALLLLGVGSLCLMGANHFINEEKKELRNKRCICR